VKADPTAQVRLLDLQAADTELAQLAHRRAHLPELAALAASDEQAGRLRSDVLELRSQLDEVADDQRRLEHEVDTVQARAKRDDQRLTAGGLPSKELEGLQHEIATLARRQSTLEDDLLEVMERRETLDAELATLTTKQDALVAERAELEATRAAAFGEIDAATQRRQAERSGIAAEIPADLLALYDKIRATVGGAGAAALRRGKCGGCREMLSTMELNEIRRAAPDEVVRHEECRRILVRTPDSGL
jgi:uncharacterized protein